VVSRFGLPSDGLLATQVCLVQRMPAGDPVRLRAVARRSAAFAGELRRAAAVLLSGAEAGIWSGVAHQAFMQQLRNEAPNLAATADRHDHYAAALAGYAGVLDEVGPRLAAARRLLQRREQELTARVRAFSGSVPAGVAGWSAVGAVGGHDPGAELLPVARSFKADYDRWADALDRCNAALLRANDTDPTRDRHGLRALEHRVAGAAGSLLSPFERAVRHPSLHNISACLGELNAGLTVLGLGLLLLCPPVAAACLITATVLGAAQLAVDATRRAHGEQVSGASLGLELAAAIPIGGGAFRGLRVAENVTHLVPGGGLMAHEGLDGGHTLTKHVGKTEQFLRHRLATEPNITAASTFYNREVAENSVAEVLRIHDKWIRSWLAGPERKLVITSSVSRTCGRVFLTSRGDPLDSSVIRVVLRRSDALGLRYRIHTAMVMA
jgi:hypothetical protein